MSDAPNRNRGRRVAVVLFGLVVSGGFLYLLLSQVDAGQVAAEIRSVDVGVLALVPLMTGLALLALGGRSGVLLRPLHRFRLPRLFRSALLGFTGNNLLPLRMGELLRIDYLARHGGVPHSSCLAVVAVERLLDLFCLALLFFALLPVAGVEMPSTGGVTLLAAGVLASLASLVFIGRDRERFLAVCRWLTAWAPARVSDWLVAKAERFASGLGSLSSPAHAIGAFALSWCYWLATLAGIAITLRAFDFELPWYAPAVVVVFLAFGVALPSAPAFVGTFHYFAMLALTLMAVEANRATSYAIVQHAIAVVPFTLVGIVALFGELLRRAHAVDPEQEPAQLAGQRQPRE